MDSQVTWHKDLLVKDVFLSPPMSSSSSPPPTAAPNVTFHHRLQQQQQLKKMEVAPSDLLMDDADLFGLNDTTCLLLDDGSGYQQHHPKVRITSVYADDLPTTPHSLMDSPSSDYLGLKRRHSSICSDSSSDDGSSVQSDSDKRPCLMHSPCSSSAPSPQLPMFDFDDDDDEEYYEDDTNQR